MDLNNKIVQLQQQLENYEHEISELKKNLDTSYNHIDEIQNLYEEQFSKINISLNNGIRILAVNKDV